MSIVGLILAVAVAGAMEPASDDWAVRPEHPVWKAAYPAAAAAAQIRGRVSVLCKIAASGYLDQCSVEKEEPAGHGFGQAMIAIAERNKLKPAAIRSFGKDAVVRYSGSFGPNDLLDTQPDWLKRPSSDDLNAVWPVKAKGVGGMAIITCNVSLAGALEKCSVRSEKPQGMDFGVAALLLAPAFRMKPGTKDGRPVVSEVSIPINFAGLGPQMADTGSHIRSGDRAMRMLPNPPFDRTPSFAELAAAWPAGTPATVTTGKTALRCRLRETGVLEGCDFAFSSGSRFERPSRELVKKFHVRMDEGVGAKDVANLYVSVAIQFVAPAQAAAPRRITHAVWTQTPDADRVAALYPAQALQQGIKSGRVSTECVVTAEGGLGDCKAMTETPTGLGFGPAAIETASMLRMTLWGDDGLPTGGATVRVPIQIEGPGQAAN